MGDHNSTYPPQNIIFLTVASSDDSNTPPVTSYSFTNVLPVPLKFNSEKVEVALYMMHYELPQGSGNDRIAQVNTSLVRYGERVGSLQTNVARIVTLRGGVNTLEPTVLQWVPANLEGREINYIGCEIEEVDGSGNPVTDLTGPTFITFGFRELEE